MDGVERLPGEIAQALERGSVVVTGNQRAARTLRNAYDRRCRAQGLGSWRPPAIVAWETWTSGLWRQMVLEGHATAMLLNSSQEHAVWRGILNADAELESLRNVDSLAGLAVDAWRLLCQHNGQTRLRSVAGSTDTRAFQRWALEFGRRCRAEDFLAAAQLEEALGGVSRSGAAVSLPQEIVLAGFDRLTPAQAALVEAVRVGGVVVEKIAMGVAPLRRVLVEAGDELEELRLAARWVRGYLEKHPSARVAVIVPNLGDRRARIDRVFREVLAPELEDIAAKSDVAPYEFSLGVPLAQTPMVSTALRLLAWTADALPLDEVSQLLLSPYFAPAEDERGGRAEIDAFVMRQARLLRPEVTPGALQEMIEGWRRNGKVPRLLMALKKMQRVIEERFGPHERRSYGGWVSAMGEVLDAAGWGAAGEDSLEFQTRRKWEGALDEMATLDFNSPRVEFGQALRRLRWIADEMMFATESRGAPVQVMGPLEAAGSRFDALWFLGAGEFSWPAATRSSSLLPWHLQRELGMPGADRAGDDEQARRVTRRVAESAATAVFSYAAEAKRGHQRRSAVLDELDLEEMDAGEFVPPEEAREVVALESVADTAALPPPPDEVVRGGAEVLRLQAACGFRAFAEKRLWSTEIGSSELGLDASASGTIVHHVLEHFWKAVKSQAALKALTQAELRTAIDDAIEKGLGTTAELSATPWDESYIDVQRERLRSLMRQWLELERGRPPFTLKLSEREFKGVEIGPLKLDVRVDRVDAGVEGDILIDYKTGRAKPADWLTDRPDAPQLPLYAMLSDPTRLEAVAFAQVRTGKEMTLTGFATSDALAKRVELTEAASLEEQVERWREVLVGLANDFYNGDARVRPKNYPTTCAYCPQRILCRLDPAEFEDHSEENAAMEAEHG